MGGGPTTLEKEKHGLRGNTRGKRSCAEVSGDCPSDLKGKNCNRENRRDTPGGGGVDKLWGEILQQFLEGPCVQKERVWDRGRGREKTKGVCLFPEDQSSAKGKKKSFRLTVTNV